MDHTDDQLLQNFVRDRSQDAFARLVNRHLRLVHSAAVRQVWERHLAEDVTQAVFVVLSRKADQLKRGTVLSAWLLSVTRYLAKDANKLVSRRRKHETAVAEAHARQVIAGDAGLSEPGDGDPWEQIAPELDWAMAKLSTSIRDAVVLRYFEQKSFKEVGSRLGVSEQAAKQRVSRGIGMLRNLLCRNAKVTAETLAVLPMLLESNAVMPAPKGMAMLAGRVFNSSLNNGNSPRSAQIAKGGMQKMAMAKLAAPAVIAASVLVVAAVVIHLFGSPHEKTLATPMGVAVGPPQVIPPANGAKRISWNPALAPAAGQLEVSVGISGTVHLPDGTPASGVKITLSTDQHPASVFEDRGEPPAAVTDDNGRFSFVSTDLVTERTAVIVRLQDSMAVVSRRSLANTPDITLQPCGQIEGTAQVAGQPLANAQVMLLFNGVSAGLSFDHQNVIKTDAEGHFSFAHIAPGRYRISRTLPAGHGFADLPVHFSWVEVTAGKMTHADLGGAGLRVVGHIDGLVDANSYTLGTLSPVNPATMPIDYGDRPPATQPTTSTSTLASAAEPYTFLVSDDGSFKVDEVPPGTYWLAATQSELSGYFTEVLSIGSKQVQVKDNGSIVLAMQPSKRLRVGDPVPAIDATDSKSQPFQWEKYRGKYVLLHFWASDRADLNWEMPTLRTIADRFGDDEHFAMVGVNLTDSPDAASIWSQNAHMGWPQYCLAKRYMIPAEYSASGCMLFLIGPDGKLLAKNLSALEAYTKLEQSIKTTAVADMPVHTEHRPLGNLGTIPARVVANSSTRTNVALHADFDVVDGTPAADGGKLQCLHDGKMPDGDDVPKKNFYFETSTLGGRVKIDLGRLVSLQQICTFSRHKSTRAPQVYRLFGSDGTAANFNPAPVTGIDPASCGWRPIAFVDTRATDGAAGGSNMVEIGDDSHPAGQYRYLLFEMFITETDDWWGNTFYSEIAAFENK
jgi:RNA polymerase sigma factor (sigma-70 family)